MDLLKKMDVSPASIIQLARQRGWKVEDENLEQTRWIWVAPDEGPAVGFYFEAEGDGWTLQDVIL